MEISDSGAATAEETVEVKKEASTLLELASSLEALTTSLDPSDTANKAFYDRAKQQQDQLKADYVGLTLSEWQATDQLSNKDEVQADYMNAASVGVTYTEWTALTDAQQADKLANSNTKGISREDEALILLNAFKFTPKTISTDGSTINRVDTSIYSAISPDSEVYIGPMDGTYTKEVNLSRIVRIIRTPINSRSTSHSSLVPQILLISLPM